MVNTWNRTGYFYARVTGRGAAFDTSIPFTLNVTKGVTTCLGVTDTVSIELTTLVRNWVADTTRKTALFLGKVPEAVSSGQLQFYSTRAPAFRPALHVTYVKRFPFGSP